ncbi:MAG: DUF4232 domain-containing protein [Chloroflexota bacterium]|nr:DUF4232 domain-containing protein [Chloroflexota bacterium]
MLRLLLVMTLISCSAPTSVAATGSPAPSPSRSAALVTSPPTAAVRSSPSVDPASVPKCSASQLQAVAAGVQTTDIFAGAIFIANRGTAACTLRGNPEVVLMTSSGSPLDVRSASVTAGAPKPVVVPVSEFRPDPAGLLGVGASAPLRWENYCDDALPTTFRVTLPEAGGVVQGTFVDLAGKPVSTFGVARCDDASGPSTVTVYPFQEPVP